MAVEIPDFTGRSSDPEWNAVRRGLNDMLTTDVLIQADKCAGKVVVVEVDRRGDIIKQLEFQQSRYVDPTTRSLRNFIIGDVVVRGTTSDVPGSPGAGNVTVQIVDKASGEVIGAVTKRVNPNSCFTDMDALGKLVGEELCKLFGRLRGYRGPGHLRHLRDPRRTRHPPRGHQGASGYEC